MKNKITLLLFFLLFSNLLYSQIFAPPIQISNDAESFSQGNILIPSDIDNDGDMDIVGYDGYPGGIIWMENINGEGELGNPQLIYYNTPIPNYIQVTDIDNDGYEDILCLDDNKVFWLKNAIPTGGTFSGPNYLPNLTFDFRKLIVADINGDSFNDIISIGDDERIRWLEAIDGLGNFDNCKNISSFGKKSLAIGDVDSDGDLDMYSLSNDLTGTYSLISFENQNGNADFDTPIVVDSSGPTSGLFISEVYLEDVDTDGDLDLFTAYSQGNGGKLFWFENVDGLGNFGAKQTIFDTTTAKMSYPEILDLDSDGDLDFLLAIEGKISIFENNGDGIFSKQPDIFQTLPSVNNPQIIGTHLNNDGILDLITATRGSQNINQILTMINLGNGEFDHPVEIGTGAGEFDNSGFFTSHDMDGDGSKDLIIGNEEYGRVGWQKFNNFPGKFSNQKLLTEIYRDPLDIDFSDLDLDGDEDMVILYRDNGIYWYEKLDDDNFGSRQVIFEGNFEFNYFKIADFDTDGDLDIIFPTDNGFSNDPKFLWCENLGNSFGSTVDLQLNTSVLGSITNNANSSIEDLDQDGDEDVLVLTNNYNILTNDYDMIWYENNNGSFADAQVLSTILAPEKPVFEDVDNDGLKDIIYSISYTLTYHKNLGQGNFGSRTNLFSGSLGVGSFLSYQLFDGDYDGDLDIYLITFFGNFQFIENLGSDNGFSFSGNSYSLPDNTKQFYVEDFDGDSDLDLITYSKSNVPNAPQLKHKIYYHENFENNPKISGIVYLDENENQLFDPDELPLNLQAVNLQPNALVSFSAGTGQFNFAVNNGAYEVVCIPSNNFTHTTTAIQTVDVMGNLISTIDFGLIPISDVTEGTTTLTAAPTRCNFNVPFWLEITNEGTVTADVVMSFELDSLVEFVSASLPPDSIIGQTIYWSIADIPPTYSELITVILKIPSVDFLGEWLSFSTTTTFTNPINGEENTSFGALRSQVNCAVDPNDKLVEPNIPDNINYTLFGDTLDYTIRFQNTGTDTAFTVIVADLIDENLDWNTFHFISSSHDVNVLLDQFSGRVLFTFENILLPDSSTNEISSHGFIRYEILHKNNLAELTAINNYADIYFDFNPPIQTNTVENILVNEQPLVVSIKNPCTGQNDGSIEVLFNSPLYESFIWSTGDTSSTINNLNAGTYTLTINTVMGNQIDTSFVLMENQPIILNAPVIEDASCFGSNDGSIFIDATGGNAELFYGWSNGVFGNQNNQLTAGEYTVLVSNILGCSISETFNINSPSPIVLSGTSIPETDQNMDGIAVVQTSGGTPPYNIWWGIPDSENMDSLFQLSAGEYTALITDANNCTSSTLIIVDQITSTINIDGKIGFQISPNPSNEIIYIDLKNRSVTNWQIDIYNQIGQHIKTIRASDLNNNFEKIKVSLPEGVFSFSLSIDNQLLQSELVIIRND